MIELKRRWFCEFYHCDFVLILPECDDPPELCPGCKFRGWVELQQKAPYDFVEQNYLIL